MATTDDAAAPQLTEEQARLYDRQIRLWGVESQRLLQQARVLVAHLSGVAAEVVKNIVLSGVGAVHILDPRAVAPRDLCANFLLPADSVGQNIAAAALPRVRALNPMVEVEALGAAGSVAELSDEQLRTYQVLFVGGGLELAEAAAVETRCRSLGVRLAFASVHGFFARAWLDTDAHTFWETRSSPPAPDQTVQVRLASLPLAAFASFASLPAPLVAQADPLLRVFVAVAAFRSGAAAGGAIGEYLASLGFSAQQCPPDVAQRLHAGWLAELPATTCIVGGILGQDIIRVVMRRDRPLAAGLLLYDGVSSTCIVENAPAPRP